ncbi:sensor histidine kinase [Pseudorhodoplanes sp.]|uniref:sensor histidine kinase n=1 Tax=Pseudorhodoplanes sp. TaxID=1934341 RepID=UPI002BC28655|nr:HWE histidine kinase domain-containing protein [Pseudorhodoplanes sp.]HWV42732.1 HWE histidine kinase domain-containing protein [Pseudorhodoplanes sp.]
MFNGVKRRSGVKTQTFFLRSLFIILAALLPVLLAFAVLGHLYSQAERHLLEERRHSMAATAALTVDRHLAERIKALESLAIAYRQNPGDNSGFQQMARAVAAKLGETIFLVDRSGNVILSTNPSQAAPSLPRVLASIQPGLQHNAPHVSDVTTDASPGTVAVVSVPVAADGAADHVLVASVSSELLNTALNDVGLQSGWLAALIDRKGVFIARTSSGPDYVGRTARPELIAVANGKEAAGTFSNVTHEGVPVESSFRKSALSGWTVVVAVPTAILERSLHRTRWVIVALFVVALLTALAFAALAGKSVVSATHALQDGALTLGRGEKVQWTPRGIVEFDDVGKALTDAQEMLRQRDDARAELHRTARLLESITHLTPDLVYVKDRQSRTLLTNPATLRLYGKEMADVRGKRAIEWHPQVDEVERIVANDRLVMERGESMQFEEPFTGVDGRRVFVSTKTPWRNEAGEIIGIVGVSTDITDREQRTQHMEFVMRELSHRSKNLLTIIQSVARQTAKQSSTFEEFHHAFDSRVQALAALHDLLVSHNWEGAGLEEIIRSQLRAFARSERVTVSGPEIVLRPDIAQVFAMAFHELATNAIKYGALSESGNVDIRWDIRDGVFELHWLERGGPKVEPPLREGFGSIVLKRVASNIPHARISYDFGSDGVRWTLTAPVESLTDIADRPAA